MNEMPEGYLELKDAAVRGECSETTIRNQAAAGAIGKLKWRGRALYREDDIAAIVAKRKEVMLVQNPGENTSVLRAFAQEIAAALTNQLAMHTERIEQQMRALLPAPAESHQTQPEATAGAVPLHLKTIVTAKEATALGFNRDKLIALVKEGRLENVGSEHRYRFRRRDLDAL